MSRENLVYENYTHSVKEYDFAELRAEQAF